MTDTRTLSFGVYGDPDGAFAVLNVPGPDTPVGTLAAVQDAVDDAIDDGEFEVELGDEFPEAGTVEFVPGKHDGRVVDIDIRGVA